MLARSCSQDPANLAPKVLPRDNVVGIMCESRRLIFRNVLRPSQAIVFTKHLFDSSLLRA